MPKRFSPLEYPLTIRLAEGFLIFAVRDLNISLVEEMPVGGKLSPEFMRKVSAMIGKSWLKSQARLKELSAAGRSHPEPSKIRVATKQIRKLKPLTAPQVGKILGVSENSVRRISKRFLQYRVTKGGHRRYSIGAVKKYSSQFGITTEAEAI